MTQFHQGEALLAEGSHRSPQLSAYAHGLPTKVAATLPCRCDNDQPIANPFGRRLRRRSIGQRLALADRTKHCHQHSVEPIGTFDVLCR